MQFIIYTLIAGNIFDYFFGCTVIEKHTCRAFSLNCTLDIESSALL